MPKIKRTIKSPPKPRPKTRRISFTVRGKAREGEPKPKARRISFIAEGGISG